ncbi:hypothetical protein AGIG_G5049 [Arapaima gigas]
MFSSTMAKTPEGTAVRKLIGTKEHSLKQKKCSSSRLLHPANFLPAAWFLLPKRFEPFDELRQRTCSGANSHRTSPQ